MRNDYNNLVDLATRLSSNFNDSLNKIDYYNRDIYYTYKSICETNLNSEISRLYEIVLRFQNYKPKNIVKKYNIKHLFIIMFVLYFIFLILYNKYN